MFLTEAIYEIKSLITTLGGNADTVMSYAGIDDIMMTCTSMESRNYTLGNMIGKNVSKEENQSLYVDPESNQGSDNFSK